MSPVVSIKHCLSLSLYCGLRLVPVCLLLIAKVTVSLTSLVRLNSRLPEIGNESTVMVIIVQKVKKYILGHQKPKKMLIFRFVGIFEYIILLMLILFLDMCQNS